MIGYLQVHNGIFVGSIVLVPLAVILIVLFALSKHKKRWLAGIGIGFAMLVLIVFMARGRARPVRVVSRPQTDAQVAWWAEVTREAYETLAVPPAWKPDNVVDWRADVYPSAESAARALGVQIALALKDTLQDEEVELKSVQVYGQVEPEVQSAAAAGLLGQLPSAEVILQATTPTRMMRRETIYVEVGIVDRFARGRPSGRRLPGERFPGEEHGGSLRLSIKGVPGGISRSARFIAKDWVDDYSGFLNLDPGRQWIVGASHTACTTEGEAKQQAAESAAMQLAPLALKRIGQLDDSVHPISPSKESVQNWFESRLQTGTVLADRFVQRYLRPYGEIWREEVLVEVTPELIDECAEALLGTHIAWRSNWKRTILSVAGMVLLICLMYLFLNSVTKGYFATRLRVSAIIAIVVVGGLVFLVIA
jgi:hypothetical protein